MKLLGNWIASLAVLAWAIALALDLWLAYAYQHPISRRQALGAVGLVLLITWRIVERMMDGSL